MAIRKDENWTVMQTTPNTETIEDEQFKDSILIELGNFASGHTNTFECVHNIEFNVAKWKKQLMEAAIQDFGKAEWDRAVKYQNTGSHDEDE